MDMILGLQTLTEIEDDGDGHSTQSNSCNNSGISLFCGCRQE